MRRWGVVVTLFYTLALVGLLLPGALLIAGGQLFDTMQGLYSEGLVWVAVCILVCGQALLLFLSVDASRKRLTPRTHIAVSYATTALLLALLTFAAIWSLAAGVLGDVAFEKPLSLLLDSRIKVLAWWSALWGLWAFLFFLYFKESPRPVAQIVSWLLKGSVLELLVAVPCHVVVRHREDCSAPMATGLGIATGLAITLLSFGPSVLFLYKKRLNSYGKRPGAG